jgi:hypothetical protein
MAVGSMFAGGFPPLRSPASELRRGQIVFRAVKFRNGGSITYFGAPVANLIQVNVGTPRSAEMAAAEDAQDVVFSGSIKKGRSLISDGNGRYESR